MHPGKSVHAANKHDAQHGTTCMQFAKSLPQFGNSYLQFHLTPESRLHFSKSLRLLMLNALDLHIRICH